MMSQEKQNPWWGLKSYTEGSTLYGRDKDTVGLVELVYYNKDAVLYGKSGIGKSSLINANLLPEMRNRNIVPVIVRLDHHSIVQKNYVQQVRHAIEAANVAIKPFARGEDDDARFATFWDFFHRNRFLLEQKGKGPKAAPEKSEVSLLIIFDQFEEIFTQQQDARKRLEFFREMAGYINDIKPSKRAEESLQLPKDKTNKKKNIRDIKLLDIVRPNGQQSPYKEDCDVRLLFSLREDFLSEFEYYTSKIPSLKQHRYGLRPLTESEAREVITIPGMDCLPQDEKERDALIDKIIDFSKDGDLKQINTLLLSLTCYLLFQKAQKRGDAKLSIHDLRQNGAGFLLEEYYEALNISSKTKIILEDKLVDSNGRRNAVNKDELTRILPDWGKLTQEGDTRILQIDSNGRVELVHDLLAFAMFKIKQRRQKKDTDRLLKISLLILVAVVFVIGMLGSVFTLNEDDRRGRVLITSSDKLRKVASDAHYFWLNDVNERAEIIDFERGDFVNGDISYIHIRRIPNLKRIIIRRNCKRISISECPQLEYLEFADSVNVRSIELKQCPKLSLFYLPNDVERIDSDKDLTLIPTNDKLVYEDGILWSKEDTCVSIRYVNNSLLTELKEGKIKIAFPNELYHHIHGDVAKVKKHVGDSIKYGQIWIYNNRADISMTEQHCIVEGDSCILGYAGRVPDSLDLSDFTIANKAFENCRTLKRITINGNTDFRGFDIFRGCNNLREVEIVQDSTFSVWKIDYLLKNISVLPHALVYNIKGDGPLEKESDGVITYQGKPVLLSDESEMRDVSREVNDTLYVCMRGWATKVKEKRSNIIGYPMIEDLSDVLINRLGVVFAKNFVLLGNTLFFLEDSFINGEINRLICCKKLSPKQRTWYIKSPNSVFFHLTNDVKRKITLIVPYGRLNEFICDARFQGFYEIKEASIGLTVYRNILFMIPQEFSSLSSSPVASCLLLVFIVLVTLFFWYLNTVKIKSGAHSSHAVIKGLARTLVMIILAFLTWLAFYWLCQYWFMGGDFISVNSSIVCNIVGVIAALLSLLLMHKNVLYLVKYLRYRTGKGKR